ncbi:hypothetical protein [Halopiger goleimassiliensis]|uniref:hypothetical protein n=1 Tax=Halopiger goleimassiliensis TaxID=1293048 RepID=UPI0012B55760|nr:hypothetical protein [Halopiger goleimassiliensis]
MSAHRFGIRPPERRDAGFAGSWLLALVLLVPVQVVSLVSFDESGLDTHVPDLVFMAVVPAVVLAGVPTLVAARIYSRRTAFAVAVVSLVVFTPLAAVTMGFYRLCGPGC